MASPSKEGLRCGRGEQKYPPWGTVDVCPGLLLEYDSNQGLGVRCSKKSRMEASAWLDKKAKCGEFHPLEVLLGQAVEQNLLSPEQRERIRRAVAENTREKTQEKFETKNYSSETAVKVVEALIIALETKQKLIEKKDQARELRKQSLFAQMFRFFFYDLSAACLEVKIAFDFSSVDCGRAEMYLRQAISRGTITVEQRAEIRNAVGYKVEFGFDGDRITPIAP